MTETNPTDPAPPRSAPPSRATKQAVILVHGMGEPTPMETLRGFVETMWVNNPDIRARWPIDKPKNQNPVWWKPDVRTGSLELSRITTREAYAADAPSTAKDGVRTDFYEFYWGDLTDANTLIQLKDWFMSLLVRWPNQVPPDVIRVWLLLWGLTLGFGGLAAWQALAKLFPCWISMPAAASVVFGIGVVIYGLLIGFVTSYFGDVARYVRAKPPNIAARRETRARGLELLRKLSGDGDYHRIVLVGHSLGTIVAYDLIKLFWAECEDMRKMTENDPVYAAIRQFETVAKALPRRPIAADLKLYRQAQSDVFDAMPEWLISDFVTVGSPLTHAEFLMARDIRAFLRGVKERRFPTSPPRFEDGSILYGGKKRGWTVYHAAPFAATRWTNIYDPAEFNFLQGDIISGPVRGNFGRGVADIPVKMRRNWVWPCQRLFTHTRYWSLTGHGDSQLPLLRQALDLLRSRPAPKHPPRAPARATPDVS